MSIFKCYNRVYCGLKGVYIVLTGVLSLVTFAIIKKIFCFLKRTEMRTLKKVIKYGMFYIPHFLLKVIFRIYGILITTNFTTEADGLFKVVMMENVQFGNNCRIHRDVIIQGYEPVAQ